MLEEAAMEKEELETEDDEDEISPERREVARRLLFTMAIFALIMGAMLAVEIIEHIIFAG